MEKAAASHAPAAVKDMIFNRKILTNPKVVNPDKLQTDNKNAGVRKYLVAVKEFTTKHCKQHT